RRPGSPAARDQMKTCPSLVLALALLSVTAVLTWPSEARGQSPPAPQAWLGERGIGEGIGLRAGDFELHPGISGEFGFDSNYFQRSGGPAEDVGGPVPAFHLRITPTISLRTLEQRVAEQDRSKDGRLFAFEASGRLSYNEFIGLRGSPELFDS